MPELRPHYLYPQTIRHTIPRSPSQDTHVLPVPHLLQFSSSAIETTERFYRLAIPYPMCPLFGSVTPYWRAAFLSPQWLGQAPLTKAR